MQSQMLAISRLWSWWYCDVSKPSKINKASSLRSQTGNCLSLCWRYPISVTYHESNHVGPSHGGEIRNPKRSQAIPGVYSRARVDKRPHGEINECPTYQVNSRSYQNYHGGSFVAEKSASPSWTTQSERRPFPILKLYRSRAHKSTDSKYPKHIK